MLIGHYAVGFAGRGALRESPQAPSLGTWFLAVQWLDLLWPILVVSGIERLQIVGGSDPFLHIDFSYYPWSHSLLAAIVWARCSPCCTAGARATDRARCGSLAA